MCVDLYFFVPLLKIYQFFLHTNKNGFGDINPTCPNAMLVLLKKKITKS